jgi:methylthioribulose-1-phosphate dehydratase
VVQVSSSAPDFENKASQLVEAGRFFYRRGWVPATSGNFSARLDDGRVAITVSGRHKGDLDLDGIMVVDGEGRSADPGKRSSAETLLHLHLYRRFPEVGAVLHTHSVNATLLSRLRAGELRLSDYELLKAFEGVDTHETRMRVPVFANDQDMERLSAAVDRYLEGHSPVYGYLISGHGLYTWGRSVQDAVRHVEAFEFLFECEMHVQRTVGP